MTPNRADRLTALVFVAAIPAQAGDGRKLWRNRADIDARLRLSGNPAN
jgi:hypothetical protein